MLTKIPQKMVKSVRNEVQSKTQEALARGSGAQAASSGTALPGQEEIKALGGWKD